MRSDGRSADELRKVVLTPGYLNHPPGSCLIEVGKTRVICSASIEDGVPGFLRGSGKGWLTAEYSMLPGSTSSRNNRERFKVGGRTQEIQRLIGRSLRMAVDLKALGERTIMLDCDVLDADGGTRTASITGAWVALKLALQKRQSENPLFPSSVIRHCVAAVSVGVVNGIPTLDLHYDDDFNADVDMNVVKADGGAYVEVQGTGENQPFPRQQLDEMLALADKGIDQLMEAQRSVF